jgi:hypothetical protein
VFAGHEKMAFRIRCYGPALVKAEERQWATDAAMSAPDADGSAVFSFTSTQYDKVLEWVLSCGDNAFPLEPARLAADWKEIVASMADMAGDI